MRVTQAPGRCIGPLDKEVRFSLAFLRINAHSARAGSRSPMRFNLFERLPFGFGREAVKENPCADGDCSV